MSPTGCGGALTSFYDRLREATAPYAGRVEYGNLRYTVSEWENAGGEKITNVALVYETPGGSTDQINISYDHAAAHFALVDESREYYTTSVDEVLASVLPRIQAIPERRREALTSEIRRQIDEG